MKATKALILALMTGVAQASPLSLTYQVDRQQDGLYHYSFDLKLTNQDGSWNGGSYNWIVFGDAPCVCELDDNGNFLFGESPLTGWVGKTISSPDVSFNYTLGTSNGPMLYGYGDGWQPTLGSVLSWSGTATALVTDLKFSTRHGTADQVVFESANMVAAVPEPSAWLLVLASLPLVAMSTRRKLSTVQNRG